MIDVVFIAKIDSELRLELLSQTFQSFVKNTNKNLINKVVIIDDNSKIDFVRYISMLEEYDFTVDINLEQLGVGGSKNKGIQISEESDKGAYLYLSDSDVYFLPNWELDLINAYEKNSSRFKIIGGGIHPFLQPRADEDTNELTSHDAVSGWSWFLEYETFNKYGKLMDNSLGTAKSEDWEYCQRIREDGYLVGCLKNQKIVHCGITNTEGELVVGSEESIRLAKSLSSEAILL